MEAQSPTGPAQALAWPFPPWGCKGCRGARRAEHSMADAQPSLGVLAAWSASFLHLWSGR